VERLARRVRTLRLGNGLDAATEVGPLIHEAALRKTAAWIEVARAEADEVITGGDVAAGAGLEHGWFFQPTILTNVRPGSRLAREEVFGPVLSVMRFATLEDAIRVNNEVDYGLSSSIYTRDVRAAFVALQELDNGITYVNAPTIGAEAHLPAFYSETKVGYVDFSGRLQRAQIDTYGN
jgi:aldehyde dehydrogenase (NAD+)